MKTIRILPLALCLSLPMAAQAADRQPTGIAAEIRQDLAEARKDVHTDLAEARKEIETGSLRLDNSLQFDGRAGRTSKHAKANLPRAEITLQGDLLIEGNAQAIDADQRRQLLAYRGLVVEIAKTGIDIGQRTAEATLDAVGNKSLAGLVFDSMTGRLERSIDKTVKQQIAPAVRDICLQLPAVMDSQQRLASSLPEFRPYATLEADDVANCEDEVRNEFASR